MNHVEHLKLVIPVVDLGHIQGTLEAIDSMNLHGGDIEVELVIPPNFPAQGGISQADQQALDSISQWTRDSRDKLLDLVNQLQKISTQPPQ